MSWNICLVFKASFSAKNTVIGITNLFVLCWELGQVFGDTEMTEACVSVRLC